MLKECKTEGHSQQLFLKVCSLILLSGGSMKIHVTGKREEQRGNGLEVPYIVSIKISDHICA